MKIYQSVTDMIGHTPMLALNSYREASCLHAAIVAKLEASNPSGSVKDRIARAMLDDAARKGLLVPNGVLI